MEICKSHMECFTKICSLCKDYEPLSSYAVLGDAAELQEELAAFTHSQWSGWMMYLFSKCKSTTDGKDNVSMIIPKWAVDRWRRQMNTEYKDLPEEEKESNKQEAAKMMQIIISRFA